MFDLSDKWYERRGVSPPQKTPHGSEAELEQRLKTSRSESCKWQQRGNDLFCDEHNFGRHGHIIDTSLILKGTKDGMPVLEKVKLVE